MRKKVKKVGITTNIMEYKSLEKYFETMARKGYILSAIKEEVFIFEKKDPRELDFMIRPICNESEYNSTNEENFKEHIKLYKYSGWEFCASNDIYIIFHKNKNMLAILIPNDIESRQKYKNIKKVFIKNDLLKMLGMIISILAACIPFFHFRYKKLFSNSELSVMLIPVFLTLGFVIRYMPTAIWFIKNRINLFMGRELSFNTNRIIQTRMKSISCYMAMVIIFVIILPSGVSDSLVMKFATNNQKKQEIVLNLSDFGETIKPANKWTDNETSVLVPVNVKYYERIAKSEKGDGSKELSTVYIRTINKSVADYIFDGYVKESNRGINKYKEKDRVWNVDRGYYLSEPKAKIIIQKDNNIYILEGSLDFSNKEIVDICEEKLGV